MTNKKTIALFLSGFFAKDVIDSVFFLMINKYPIEIFGFRITAASHKIMLAVSTVFTALFFYYGLKKNKADMQSKAHV